MLIENNGDIWFVVEQNLVCASLGNEYHHLPNFIRIKGFVLKNSTTDRYGRKIFPTIQEAVLYAAGKLKNKPAGYSYSVRVFYESVRIGNELSPHALLVEKNEEGVKITNNLFGKRKFENMHLSEDELQHINELSEIPYDWVSAVRLFSQTKKET